MTKEQIKTELTEALNRKMRNRLATEVSALRSAERDRDIINSQIQGIQNKIDEAKAELSRLEDKVEKEILAGNAPNAEIRQVGLQKLTMESYAKQVDAQNKALGEANEKVEAAARTLADRLKREIPAERDLEEEKVQGYLNQAMMSREAFEYAVRAVFADLGVRYDSQKDRRLVLMYTLNFDALIQHHENARDAGFYYATKNIRAARGKALRE
jgi:chromosome segregation ATPase